MPLDALLNVDIPTPDTPSSTVWDIPASAGVTVTIEAFRSDFEVAPEGFSFRAVTSGFDIDTAGTESGYDAGFSTHYCFWDYGDSYIWSAPTQVAAMDSADGGNRTDSRYSRGPMGAHVFRAAGNYTVRCAVFEVSSQKWGQATYQIGGAGQDTNTIQDPDTFFSASERLLAPSGGDFTTLSAAASWLMAQTTPSRLLIANGQEYTFSNNTQFRYRPNSGATLGLRIEAENPAGTKPVLISPNGLEDAGATGGGLGIITDQTNRNANPTSTMSVFAGLEWRGDWDTTTFPSGTWKNVALGLHPANGGRVNQAVIDRCDVSGHQQAVHTISEGGGRNTDSVYFNDSTVTDWSNYGVLDSSRGHYHVLGSRLAQNVDALAGGIKASDNSGSSSVTDREYTNHGPARHLTPNRTIYISTDIFSNTGWSDYSATNPNTNTTRVRAIQPDIRWNTSAPFSGPRLVLSECALEGPRLPIQIAMANNSAPADLVNALIEACFIAAGFQSFGAIGLTSGGLTIRNNVITFADTEYNMSAIGENRTDDPEAAIYARGDRRVSQSRSGNLGTPIKFYQNTVINRSDRALTKLWDNGLGGGQTWNFTSVRLSNNLLVQLSGSAAQITETPNSVTYTTPVDSGEIASTAETQMFTPRFKGYRDTSTGTLFTQYATPSTSGRLYTPQAGSNALNWTYTGTVGIGEFTPSYAGNVAVPRTTAGAVEA